MTTKTTTANTKFVFNRGTSERDIKLILRASERILASAEAFDEWGVPNGIRSWISHEVHISKRAGAEPDLTIHTNGGGEPQILKLLIQTEQAKLNRPTITRITPLELRGDTHKIRDIVISAHMSVKSRARSPKQKVEVQSEKKTEEHRKSQPAVLTELGLELAEVSSRK